MKISFKKNFRKYWKYLLLGILCSLFCNFISIPKTYAMVGIPISDKVLELPDFPNFDYQSDTFYITLRVSNPGPDYLNNAVFILHAYLVDGNYSFEFNKDLSNHAGLSVDQLYDVPNSVRKKIRRCSISVNYDNRYDISSFTNLRENEWSCGEKGDLDRDVFYKFLSLYNGNLVTINDFNNLYSKYPTKEENKAECNNNMDCSINYLLASSSPVINTFNNKIFDSPEFYVNGMKLKKTLNNGRFSYVIRDDEIVTNKTANIKIVIKNYNIGKEQIDYLDNFNGNEVEIPYNFCSYNESTDVSTCELQIKYNKSNKNDIIFSFDIKSSNKTIEIYENIIYTYDYDKNLVYENDEEIDDENKYTYSKINLYNKNIVGIVFIPYDYLNLEYDLENKEIIKEIETDMNLLNYKKMNKVFASRGYIEKNENGKFIISPDSLFQFVDLWEKTENKFEKWDVAYKKGRLLWNDEKYPALIFMNKIDKTFMNNEPNHILNITYNSSLYKYIYVYENDDGGLYLDSEVIKVRDNDGSIMNVGGSSSDTSNINMNYSLLTNLSGWLPPGPVDSILNLPFALLNSIKNSLSGQCSPVKIKFPFVNYEMNIPCMNTFYENIGATSFFNWIGVIASTLMLYSYFIFLYNWIDGLTTLTRKKLEMWGSDY